MTYTRTNLVPNPSATVNTTGWAATTGTLTRDTTVSRSGGASFKITAGTGMDTPAGTSGIPVTPGTTYRFSFWALGNNTTDQATFQCSWYDSGGALISSASPVYTALNTTAWVLVAPANPATLYTAPSNAAYLQLRPRINATSTVWFDDIMVEVVAPGTGNPVYFDGTTTDTADETFSWSGTADQSASTAVYTGRTNLLPNPSFEIDTSGWTGTSRTVSAGSPVVISGNCYASVSSTTISDKQPAAAGVDYTASAWLARTGTAARSATVGIRFYNSAGTELDAPTLTQTALVTQNVPERRSMTRTAPAGTFSMAFVVSASSSIAGDAFLLERSSTLSDFFDGDSTAAAGTYVYWTGTPHNSPSRLGTAAPPQRTNLFTHPSAEGAAITWTPIIGAPTVGRTTEAALFGSESYKITAADASNQELDSPSGTSGFPVLAGQSYTFTAYSGRSGATPQRQFTVKIHYYTSAGTFISTTSSGTGISEASGTTLAWVRGTVSAVAPVNAAFAAVQVRWSTAWTVGEVHYFDGLMFEQTPYILEYFDGSSTKNGYVHAWTGTAHASTSTRTGGSTDPTVTFKRYESGAWVLRTAKPKAWNGTAWVIRRPKYWNGASWVDLE